MALAISPTKAHSWSMNTTANYVNYALWILILICAAGVTVAVLVSR